MTASGAGGCFAAGMGRSKEADLWFAAAVDKMRCRHVNSCCTYFRAGGLMSPKSNITLKLDADLLRRVKVLAAQTGTSVSAMLTTKLEEVVTKDEEYEEAKNRAKALMRESAGSGWRKPKSRDELHER